MKLIVILISIAMLRYVQFGRTVNRYHWLQKYAASIQVYLQKIQQPWVIMMVILLPILIIALFLQLVLAHGMFYVIKFLFSILVLWYCLWPVSLRESLDASLAKPELAKDQPSSEIQDEDVEHGQDNATHVLTKALLCDANTYTFAVLFWYIVLGPLGAILYRMVAQLTNLSSKPNDTTLNGIIGVAHTLENLLDWIPVRLVALGYALAGHFVKSFSQWMHYLKGGLGSNQDLLIASGLGAMDIDPQKPGDAEEAQQVLRMVDRALIVWLIVITIFTIGQFIY